MFLGIFNQDWHVLVTLLEKWTMNFPRIYWQTVKSQKRTIFYQIAYAFLRRIFKISLKWFLLVFMLKQKCELNFLLRKQKPCQGTINSRLRNVRMVPKMCFQFHWNCKQPRLEAMNSMLNCYFSQILHKQFWNYFQSLMFYSVGSDYYEKYGVRIADQFAKLPKGL